MNNEVEEVSIQLDPEVASRVTHLCREFGIQDESELLEWMVKYSEKKLEQKLDGKRVLLSELFPVVEHSDREERIARGFEFWDQREEVRVRVDLTQQWNPRTRRRYWHARVEALPAFPEGPFIPGGPLSVSGWMKPAHDPEGVTIFLTLRYRRHTSTPFLSGEESIDLVFESLSAAALEDVRSRIGDEFILERSTEEIEDLPFAQPGDGIPKTPARVLPPDFDFEDAEA